MLCMYVHIQVRDYIHRLSSKKLATLQSISELRRGHMTALIGRFLVGVYESWLLQGALRCGETRRMSGVC